MCPASGFKWEGDPMVLRPLWPSPAHPNRSRGQSRYVDDHLRAVIVHQPTPLVPFGGPVPVEPVVTAPPVSLALAPAGQAANHGAAAAFTARCSTRRRDSRSTRAQRRLLPLARSTGWPVKLCRMAPCSVMAAW